VSLQGVIAFFNTGTYVVTREGEGDYVLGRWESGAQTTFSIQASVQPMSGNELKDLPEGVRTEETRILWTLTQLRGPEKEPADSGAGADLVDIDNKRYRVWKVEHHTLLSDHYRVTVVRESPL
jgi:hypothetical protein